MNIFPRTLRPRVFLAIFAGIMGVSGAALAQNHEKPAEAAKNQTASEPAKPVHKSEWVTTNDSIVRLGIPRDPGVAEAAAKDGAKNAILAAKEASATAGDAANRKAEIAALDKQIQDRQKRVALLMRLFVNDERPFLNNPGAGQAGTVERERRNYEQDELLYDSAEIARLRTRLEQLKGVE